MDAQAAAVLEAALAQEGIRVADLSNEELAAIVATMYSALGQQPPNVVGPVSASTNDEEDQADFDAEDDGESAHDADRVEEAGGVDGLGSSHAADRSALDESPRGSRQPWMHSSELLGDSVPLMPPSGRSPAVAVDHSPAPAVAAGSSAVDRADQRGNAARSSDALVKQAQLQYPPVDELFAGATEDSEASSRRTSSAVGAAAQGTMSRRSMGTLDDYSHTRSRVDERDDYPDDHDGADDGNEYVARGSSNGGASIGPPQQASLRDDSTPRGPPQQASLRDDSSQFGRPSMRGEVDSSQFGRLSMRGDGDGSSTSVSAWAPAPVHRAEGRTSAASASAAAPVAAAMPAPPPPAAYSHAAAASRGGTAPPSRRNSFGAGSAATDALAAPAPAAASAAVAPGYGFYGHYSSSEGVAVARRSTARAEPHGLPPSRAAAAAPVTHAPTPQAQLLVYGASAGAASSSHSDAVDGAADGYVSVLLSTLQTNAAAVAEAEAELRLVVRER